MGNFKDVLSRKKEMNFYTPEEFKKYIKVAKRLGHTKVEITWNTYSHLYPREEERAIEILNAV